MTALAVFTTVGSRYEARAMARAIVERHLAACAQISEIESFYPWDGAIQHDTEFRILFKTTADGREALEAAIRELHRYELPAIHAMAFEHVDPRYEAWIAEQVTVTPLP